MTRKVLLVLALVVLILALMTSVASSAGKDVFGSFSFFVFSADDQVRQAGGGVLYADGSAAGGGFATFGSHVIHVQVTGWTGNATEVNICATLTPIKPPGAAYPSCTGPQPVTGHGQPIMQDFDSDGSPDFIWRVTLAE